MIPIAPNPPQPLRPGPARAVTLCFVMLLAAVPIGQVAWEVSQGEPPQVLDLFSAAPSLSHFQSFETALGEASVVAKAIRPWIQRGLIVLRQGNRKVVIGRDGWLFYRPSVEHHTGPAIDLSMDDGSPLKAIVAYREALVERGITLLLVPVPTKVAWHADQLQPSRDPEPPYDLAANRSWQAFLARLEAANVRYVALDEDFAMVRGNSSVGYMYQPFDTHWAANLSRLAASFTAGCLPEPDAAHRVDWQEAHGQDVRNRGDLYDMLDLPACCPPVPEFEDWIQPVVDEEGQPWQPDPQAEVLLLGDSFANIYSDPSLGWGSGAGFAEHLSYWGHRTIDVVALNDGGVNGSRQALARQPGRLDGKQVVIWQFAARDLTAKAGEWAVVPLPARETER